MPKLEKGFKAGYKSEEPEDEEEKIEEEGLDEAEELEEEKLEEEKIEPGLPESQPEEEHEKESPKSAGNKPKRIVIQPPVVYDRPKKGSWVVFEAPDKNGKKIVKYFGKAGIMKEKLLAQEEVVTFIPREQGEHKSVPQIVNLNGYKLNIPKNTYVSLPAQVAEVIRNAHQQVEDAYNEMNRLYGLDRDNKAVEALL